MTQKGGAEAALQRALIDMGRQCVEAEEDRDRLVAFAKAVMRSHRGGTSAAVLLAFEQLPPELQQCIGLDGAEPEEPAVQP